MRVRRQSVGDPDASLETAAPSDHEPTVRLRVRSAGPSDTDQDSTPEVAPAATGLPARSEERPKDPITAHERVSNTLGDPLCDAEVDAGETAEPEGVSAELDAGAFLAADDHDNTRAKTRAETETNAVSSVETSEASSGLTGELAGSSAGPPETPLETPVDGLAEKLAPGSTTAAAPDRYGSAPLVPSLSVAAHSLANTRGKDNQDRWATGSSVHGTWVAVADGISGGSRGAAAAEAAIGVLGPFLTNSALDEAAMRRVFAAANAAVSPWYGKQHRGGTTLTLAFVTDRRILIGQVGDSPAWLLTCDGEDGALREVAPAAAPGVPLIEWIGSSRQPEPTFSEHPRGASHLIVATDGVSPRRVAATFVLSDPCSRASHRRASSVQRLSATEIVAELLSERSTNDDATVVVVDLCGGPSDLGSVDGRDRVQEGQRLRTASVAEGGWSR